MREFVNGYTLLREMGFSSTNVSEALLMFDNDTDKALAHFLNSSSWVCYGDARAIEYSGDHISHMASRVSCNTVWLFYLGVIDCKKHSKPQNRQLALLTFCHSLRSNLNIFVLSFESYKYFPLRYPMDISFFFLSGKPAWMVISRLCWTFSLNSNH